MRGEKNQTVPCASTFLGGILSPQTTSPRGCDGVPQLSMAQRGLGWCLLPSHPSHRINLWSHPGVFFSTTCAVADGELV